jgi:hypothetical protein
MLLWGLDKRRTSHLPFNNAIGVSGNRVLTLTALDEYGFSKEIHNLLRTTGALGGFIAGAIFTKILDLIFSRWKKPAAA